jgi:hypothetical protein
MSHPLSTLLHGYRTARPVERAGFGFLSSFATTIPLARAINYRRERRRHLPAVRSLSRRVFTASRTGGLRIHHFLPGIARAFVPGAAAVLTRTEGAELRFGVPFGVGTALTTDELALLFDVDNPYWRSERWALLQAGVAAAGVAALTARFGWLGRHIDEIFADAPRSVPRR